MKIVLAGAFGKLGIELLKKLISEGHEVIAAGRTERVLEELKGKYTFFPMDVQDPETLKGLCKGADAVISTVGLTGVSKETNCYEVDYKGNVRLMKAAKRAGVKKFVYISVLSCDHEDAKTVPMMHAKYKAEEKLKESGMDYVIVRPTGYFYDIVKVFRPYIEKGKMQLLRGYGSVSANVIDCEDLAAFICDHMNESNAIFEVGGTETYTYEEMAHMCFEAAGKPAVIQYVPKMLFSVLANLPKIRKEGKRDVILFSRFTLSHDLVGKDVTGDKSFAQYIRQEFSNKEET